MVVLFYEGEQVTITGAVEWAIEDPIVTTGDAIKYRVVDYGTNQLRAEGTTVYDSETQTFTLVITPEQTRNAFKGNTLLRFYADITGTNARLIVSDTQIALICKPL